MHVALHLYLNVFMFEYLPDDEASLVVWKHVFNIQGELWYKTSVH